MACTENDTSLDIKIPALMISKSEGENIMKTLASGGRGKLLFCPLANRLVLNPSRVIFSCSVFLSYVICLFAVSRYTFILSSILPLFLLYMQVITQVHMCTHTKLYAWQCRSFLPLETARPGYRKIFLSNKTILITIFKNYTTSSWYYVNTLFITSSPTVTN